jgi:hypothetical protein
MFVFTRVCKYFVFINKCYTGHTQTNGAVSMWILMITAPFFCVYPVLTDFFFSETSNLVTSLSQVPRLWSKLHQTIILNLYIYQDMHPIWLQVSRDAMTFRYFSNIRRFVSSFCLHLQEKKTTRQNSVSYPGDIVSEIGSNTNTWPSGCAGVALSLRIFESKMCELQPTILIFFFWSVANVNFPEMEEDGTHPPF